MRKTHVEEFALIQAEDRRLCVLTFLREASGGQANDFVMQRVLKSMGHAVARSVVRDDFTFLSARNLVTVKVFNLESKTATITDKGCDVADGFLRVEGVQAPRGV